MQNIVEVILLLIGQGQAAGQDKLTAMIGSPTHDCFQVGVVITQPWQDGHAAGAGQDAGPGKGFHGGEALFRGRRQAFHLTNPGVTWRIGRADQAESHHAGRAAVHFLEQGQDRVKPAVSGRG